ncbi:hypothetical protein HMSSN036_34840 [Paenibacillus macerans]|nr:hypothetical protein HMSSN036_34840 [Paenibacillus macerans]
MEVPSTWTGQQIGAKTLPASGFATYRAVLKNLPHDGIFAIKKTNIRFSSTVYVNGQKLLEDGKPSGQAGTYKAGNFPQVALFSAERGDVEIIVQAANYDYVNAGIPVSIFSASRPPWSSIRSKLWRLNSALWPRWESSLSFI